MQNNKRQRGSSDTKHDDIIVGSEVYHLGGKFLGVVGCRVRNVVVFQQPCHLPFTGIVNKDGSDIVVPTGKVVEITQEALREGNFSIRMLYVLTTTVNDINDNDKAQMQQECLAIMEATYKNSLDRLYEQHMFYIQLLQKLLAGKDNKPLTPNEVLEKFGPTLNHRNLISFEDKTEVTNDGLEPNIEFEDEAVPEQPHTVLPFNLVNATQLDAVPAEVRDVFTYLRNANKLGDCRFHVLDVLSRVYFHLVQPKAKIVPRMMGGGRTQIGKTFLKVVTALMAHRMGLTTVVVTPGSVNVTALCGTIQGHLLQISNGLPQNTVPYCFEMTPKGKNKMGTPLKGTMIRDAVDDAFKNGGVIVINYVYAALDKVLDRVNTQGARGIVLVLDEADECYKAGKNKQEIELARFEEAKFDTRLIFGVTATILPLLLRGVLTTGLEFDQKDVVTLVPEQDYISTEDLQRLTRSGSQVSLDLNNLSWRNQYLDDELLKLYDDAIACDNVANCKALIVDISNPRVSAEGGLCDKANVIMTRYPGIEIRILLVTGNFICSTQFDHRGEGKYTKWKYFDKQVKLKDALFQVAQGWNGPIVVLGYSQLIRGVSVRTNTRVPTHIAVGLTKGLSREKLVQAMGRGTGNFREQLRSNGYQFTTILCSDDDYDAVTDYSKVIETFTKMLGETNGDVEHSLNRALVNFVKPGARPVGYAKTGWLAQIVRFCPSACPIPERDLSAMKRKDLIVFCKSYFVGINGTETIETLIALITAAKKERDDHLAEIHETLPRAVQPAVLRGIDTLRAFLPQHFRVAETKIEGDGNCFFRAFAHNRLEDQELHYEVRNNAVEFAKSLPPWFWEFDFEEEGGVDAWLENMSRPGTWADEPIMAATAEYYKVRIVLYSDLRFITRYPDNCDETLHEVTLGFIDEDKHYVALELKKNSETAMEEDQVRDRYAMCGYGVNQNRRDTRVAAVTTAVADLHKVQATLETTTREQLAAQGLGAFQEEREKKIAMDMSRMGL